jgi:glycosyltransferase involved in cell wall biosynthesis
MALSTAEGLAGDYRVIFLGPAGPALVEARRLGFETIHFQTIPQLLAIFARLLWSLDGFTFVATLPRYTKLFNRVNLVFRRHVKVVQMIHGGGNEDVDYAPLPMFNNKGVTFVAVSDYGRDRLIHHGVRADRIEVVGNFLTERQRALMPRRPRFARDGVRNITLVSRVDPPKRVDLLLDALDCCGEKMRDVSFRILGCGPDLERLRERARRTHPNVTFAGYVDNVAAELARSDLLVHTCPVETFGMAVLEAMLVDLPSLVPDAGGTATLVEDGRTGFTFSANDAGHLAERLLALKSAPAALLNRMARNARLECEARFSEEASIAQYREIFRSW